MLSQMQLKELLVRMDTMFSELSKIKSILEEEILFTQDDLDREIKKASETGGIVQAVHMYRRINGGSLLDCKKAVEELIAKRREHQLTWSGT